MMGAGWALPRPFLYLHLFLTIKKKRLRIAVQWGRVPRSLRNFIVNIHYQETFRENFVEEKQLFIAVTKQRIVKKD
jgi:hypothetical protein